MLAGVGPRQTRDPVSKETVARTTIGLESGDLWAAQRILWREIAWRKDSARRFLTLE
jgi:hypothetical protein